MYANYLIDVGKLVFIIGDTQSTTQFKNLFQSSVKQKIFYKCMQQLPADTYKKEKVPQQRTGIIRKDWFNKILNKNPQMIIMIFNCTAQLGENQVWEDRLKIMIKKINRVYDIMKSNSKQQVRLRIIILISKHTFGGINLHQKMTTFLKTYQKQLFIIQYEYYAKQITKIRSQWIYSLEKNYDNKYKKIQKRYEESFLERKLGCMVKMAILAEMMSKKDEKEKYMETYKALRFYRYQFVQVIKSVSILNHNQVRQIRSVSDVIFLRFLKTLISQNASPSLLFNQTLEHMNYFKLKNLGHNQTNKYYYYEELLWRCTFIQNFLEILYKNDLMENVSTLSLCELLNQLITYLHALAIVDQNILKDEKMLGANILKQKEEYYLGYISYEANGDLLETDIVYTFISGIIAHKKDFLSKGIQLITRQIPLIKIQIQNYEHIQEKLTSLSQCLSSEIVLPRQQLFNYLNVDKFQNFLTTYEEIMKQEMERSNYFLLNQMFNQIKEQFLSITEQQKVIFYGVSCLICDYFENLTQLSDHLEHLMISYSKHENEVKSKSITLNEGLLIQEPKTVNKQAQMYRFALKKKSNIGSVSCFIKNQFVYIEEQIKLKLQIRLNKVLLKTGCKLLFIFNHEKLNKQVIIEPNTAQQSLQKILTISPLQHFTTDQTCSLRSVLINPLTCPNLWFTISNNHITFIKHKQNKIFTQIRCPEVQINNPYFTYYINEVGKFQINIEKLQGFTVEGKCSIKEEDAYGKTEVFVDFDGDRINLINSNYYQQLVSQCRITNKFWLKCNKLGQKVLKFTFQFTIEKKITKQQLNLLENQTQSQSKSYILRQSFSLTKQMKFFVKQLFTIKKTFWEFSNDDNKPIENRNIPVDKKILAIVQLQSKEDIFVKEIGQHKNPKRIQYLKQIRSGSFSFPQNNKLKLNMIFKLPHQSQQEIQLFLMSLYIKWSRLPTKFIPEPYENLFIDHQTKINCFLNPLSISLSTPENYLTKKNELTKLLVKVKNHSENKNHLFIVVEGNAMVLRVGEKEKAVYIGPKEQTVVDFDLLPVVSGFLTLPGVKIFVDGVQRNLNLSSSQVIKSM